MPLLRFGTINEVAVPAACTSADQVEPPSDEYLTSKPSVGASTVARVAPLAQFNTT